MPSLTTYDGLVARNAAGFWRQEPIYGNKAASTSSFLAIPSLPFAQLARTKVLPTMESGVSAYIPTKVVFGSTNINVLFLLAACVDMGSLDTSTNVFTDGAAMPTVTEFGNSVTLPGFLIGVLEAATNATPGSLSVTYVDQDGNTAEASPVTALTASAAINTAGSIPLNTGDFGVQNITGAVRTGGTTPTGTIRFFGLRPLAMLQANVASSGLNANDLVVTRQRVHRLLAGADVRVFSVVHSGSQSTVAAVALGNIFYVGDT